MYKLRCSRDRSLRNTGILFDDSQVAYYLRRTRIGKVSIRVLFYESESILTSLIQ